MTLGERVKQRRKELQWTQEDLAQKSGVGQGTISKMERTGQEASTYVVELADALGVSPQWLNTGTTTTKVRESVAPYKASSKNIKRAQAIENASEEVKAALDRMLGIKD